MSEVAQLTAERDALRQRVMDLEAALSSAQRTETVLRQKSIEMEALLEAIPALVYFKSRDHRYLYGNQAFAETVGMPVSALAGKTDADLFAADVAQLYQADDEGIMASGTPNMNLESHIILPNGSDLWLKAHNVPYRDADGQVIGMVGVAIDITAQKETEFALRQQTWEWQTLLDAIPAQVFFKDRQHHYWRVNHVYAETFGLTMDQIIGRTDHDFFPRALADVFHENDEAVMVSGEARRGVEMCIEQPNGLTQWTSEYTIPLRDKSNDVVGLVGVGIDITAYKQAEAVLKEREAQLQVVVDQQARLIETIKVLSTPLIPIQEGVVALPLVGHVDTARGQQIIETLLEGVQRYQAECIIIDITGVPMIDTAVANYLVQGARGVQLLGARCVLVGTSPEVAQTLVQLGVDLSSLHTQRDLQAGVAYALAQRRS